MNSKAIRMILAMLISLCLIASCSVDPITYCSVIIDKANGEALSSTEVLDGSEYTLPAAPQKANHTFAGWYIGDKKIESKTVTINGDTVITAHYTENEHKDYYTVHYMFRNLDKAGMSKELYSEQVKPLEVITLADKVQNLDGYTFKNWYLIDAPKQENLAPETITITGDTYIFDYYENFEQKVEQVSITLVETDGTNTATRTIKKDLNAVSSKNCIDKISTLINKTKCYFIEAYHDEEHTQPIELPYTFTKDETIYVQYTKETVKITKNGNYGSESQKTSPVTIGKGSKYYLSEMLPSTTVKGEIFEGWYYDPEFTQPVDEYKIIDSDINVYAKWNKDCYKVTYHFIDSPEKDNTKIEYKAKNSEYTIKDSLGKDGKYTQAGFYYDPECTQKAEGTITLTNDIDLYQKWEVANKLLKIYLNNGEPNIELWLPVGSIFDLSTIPEPTREGYKFIGWGKSSNVVDKLSNLMISVGSSSNNYYAIFDNSWNAFADISWYNTAQSTFDIDTPEKLAGVAYLVNNGFTNFKNKTIVLQNDIDLSAHQWIPIGGVKNKNTTENIYTLKDSDFYQFLGKFDGQEHTIKNMNIVRNNIQGGYVVESCYNGLFGVVGSGASIKNVTMDNAYIYGDMMNGAVVGYVPANEKTAKAVVLENLNVINSEIKSQANSGAILGRSEAGNTLVNIKSCSVDNVKLSNIKKTDSRTFFGGIVGVLYSEKANTIDSCTVSNSTIAGTDEIVGGLAGAVNVATITNPTIKTTSISLPDTTNPSVGKIVGGLVGSNSKVTIKGTVTAGEDVTISTEKESMKTNEGYVGAYCTEETYESPSEKITFEQL